jgi:hypothetical protein
VRNEILDALFARLIAAPGLAGVLKTTGKNHLKLPKDVPHDKQPALFLVDTTSDPKGGWNQANAWELHYRLYLYARGAKNDGGAQAQRNALMDAVDQALKGPPPTGRQTLGGLVYEARISGQPETDEGVLGEQAVAWMPIYARLA